jgi:phosphoribosylanthranilate isomerase
MMIQIKVCGMRDTENVREVSKLRPDFLGFIFYPASKRFVGENPDVSMLLSVSKRIKKVGVFVNEENEKVLKIASRYNLDLLQLHGSETPKDCRTLKSAGYQVIKAFGMEPAFNYTTLMPYLQCCDYFLFDTKSDQFGGVGQKFNWEKIREYKYNVPFFLSGGIGPEDHAMILEIQHPAMVAIDINSQFETEPGLKNVSLVRNFIKRLKEGRSGEVDIPRRGGSNY